MKDWVYKLFDWRRLPNLADPHKAPFVGAGNVNWHMRSDPRKETAKLVAQKIRKTRHRLKPK